MDIVTKIETKTTHEEELLNTSSSCFLISNDDLIQQQQQLSQQSLLSLQRAAPSSSFSLLTDLAEEIYANEVKRSKRRDSLRNNEFFNSMHNIEQKQNVIKRPQTVPTNRIFEKLKIEPKIEAENEASIETNKRMSIEAIKNDLVNLNESIKAKNDRAKSAYLPSQNDKHKDTEQSELSKHVCQVCGPNACHLCSEQNQRKFLHNKETEPKIMRSPTNQTIITVNTKSAQSTKPPLSSVTYLNNNDEGPYNPENVKLLSIIIKNKYNINSTEDEIEEMIKNEKLYILNRSSPYNLKRGVNQNSQAPLTTRTVTTLPSATVTFENDDNETDIYNTDVYEQYPQSVTSNKTTRTLKEFDEPLTTKPTLEKTLNSLKKFNVTEYYFKNMKDLRAKAFFKRDKLLLSRTPVPTSSNKLFLNIERFDIADRYKKMQSTLKYSLSTKNQSTKSSSKRNSISDSYKPQKPVDEFEKYKFVSLKKFQILEPNFKQLYEPPMLQLKMQKFDEIYANSKHDKNFKIINRRAKF